MKFSVDKILEALKKLTPKQITMIIMCVMLTVTVIMATVVIVKVSPVLSALLGTPDETVPTEPSTETTVPPTSEPEDTQPTTTPEATNPAHVHKYDTIYKEVEATCTSAGYTLYSCKCGATEMRDSVDALGHSYGPSKLVAPTCTESGYTYRKCNACDYEDKRDETDALDHDFKLAEEKDATCTEDGYTLYKCTRTDCDEEKREDEVKALGHKWSKGEVKKPTCEEAGYTEYTCTNSGCKEKKQENDTDALGHKYGDWKVTTDPKKGDAGIQTRTCTNTGCTEEETQPCPLTPDKTKETESDHIKYTINMVAKNKKDKNVVVYSYTVTDYGKFKDLSFEFDEESGLIVTFTDGSGKPQTYPWTGGETLYISADGKLSATDPGPAETEPSETTQPTETSQPQGGANE